MFHAVSATQAANGEIEKLIGARFAGRVWLDTREKVQQLQNVLGVSAMNEVTGGLAGAQQPVDSSDNRAASLAEIAIGYRFMQHVDRPESTECQALDPIRQRWREPRKASGLIVGRTGVLLTGDIVAKVRPTEALHAAIRAHAPDSATRSLVLF